MSLWLGAAGTVAVTDDAAERTRRYTLASEALGEEREILVRTPPGYDPARAYPAVFLTDGEWNFELVAAYLDYLVDNGVYPPLVVTGTINVNRNRDYVPRADRYFDETGKADRFLDYVEKEWIPFMRGRHRLTGERVLLGHSFGGVFTLHALFSGRQLFDAYIALGSSAWIADQVLFEEARTWFKARPSADEFVYMAVGEGDGGPTVPSSEALAELFEQQAPPGLEWTFSITPRTEHFKNTVSGMHEGFMALFPGWGFPEQLEAAAEDGATGVKRWFAEKERQLGWRFQPAWFELGVLASRLARADRTGAALEVMRQLCRYHPDNVHVVAFSAGVFESAGDRDNAAAEYRRAIAMARERNLHPNEIHIARLERGLARVTQ
jgi:predicted alpha/beta superfamily hydrolase